MQNKIIVVLSLLLLTAIAYIGYDNRGFFLRYMPQIDQNGINNATGDNSSNVIDSTGEILITGTTQVISGIDEYSQSNSFIQNLSKDGVLVDFDKICPYAKNLLKEYIQKPDTYLVVYKKATDEYGNYINDKSWDFAEVYDISQKDDIETMLDTQKQLLTTQPLSIQVLPGSLGYSPKVNNSNYFWIETRRDEQYQYSIFDHIVLTDINKRPEAIIHIRTIYHECEEPEFYGDVAGLDNLLVNKDEIKSITNNYRVNNRRNIVNNFISQKNVQKVKDTEYGSIILTNSITNSQGIYMVYITINHGKLIAIPISFTERIGDEGDSVGRLLGAIRKRDGSYPKLMQPGSCPEHNQQGYGPYDYCDKTEKSIRDYIQSLIDGSKKSPYFDAMVDSFERAINDLYIQQ